MLILIEPQSVHHQYLLSLEHLNVFFGFLALNILKNSSCHSTNFSNRVMWFLHSTFSFSPVITVTSVYLMLQLSKILLHPFACSWIIFRTHPWGALLAATLSDSTFPILEYWGLYIKKIKSNLKSYSYSPIIIPIIYSKLCGVEWYWRMS